VRVGVARTPQGTVVPPLVPARQVAVAVRGGSPAPHAVARHLLATPRSRAATTARDHVAATALRLTGLQGVADRDPATLTVGEQRLLQVARAVATGAGVLLLDEPAAGMTADERARLRGVLRTLAGNGCAVLLVEHDMALVAAVADRVTVLAGGRVLSSGTPGQVRADPAVRSAYLGAPTP
jgi:ABC-type branched-subunit amino acid transport system ATPase component